MAFRCRFPVILLLSALTGCAAIPPRPDRVRAQDLPEVALTEAQQVQCTRYEQDAIEAVVRRRYEVAEAAANRALAIHARSARARAVIGMVRLQQAARELPIEWSGLRRGEAEIELAWQLAPDDAFVGWMRAVFLAESGHMSAAAAAAEQSLARTEQAPIAERAALLGIAGTYRYELGEERAALPHLYAYVALRKDDSAAHFRLGSSLLRIAAVPQGTDPKAYLLKAQREAEAAAKAFARCFELAPGDEDAALAVAAAWLRAAELAEERQQPAERDGWRSQAVEHLRAVGERFPDSAAAPFRLGVVAALQGDRATARAAYSEALERDPDHAGSLMNLASLLVDDGQQGAARDLLVRLLAADPLHTRLTRSERQRIGRWLSELSQIADSGFAGDEAPRTGVWILPR